MLDNLQVLKMPLADLGLVAKKYMLNPRLTIATVIVTKIVIVKTNFFFIIIFILYSKNLGCQ